MKKLISSVVAAAILFAGIECSAESTDAETIRFPNYSVMLSDKGKIPGVYNLKAGSLIMDSIQTRGNVNLDNGKHFYLSERKENQGKRKKNCFMIDKVLSNHIGNKIVKTFSEIEFTENLISVKLKLKALANFKFSYLFSIGDCLLFKTSDISGTNIEATRISGKILSGIIPRQVTKENWGLNGLFRKFSLIKDDVILTFSTEDGIIYVSNGKWLTIVIFPNAKRYEWQMKNGEERTVSYTIKIEKI